MNAADESVARELALFRAMLRIRRFEEKCVELYSASKIRGFLHLYIGEEAIAAGVMAALGPEDSVVSTYREHGHALARGMSMRALLAEMFGKAAGCSRGRGGSMHLFDARLRFFGGNAIVAGGLPLAVGIALADKLRARPLVTACFFGEGAVAEGEFHESLNLAALWKLPVVFCCENNLYAMGTALARSEAETNLAIKAASYELPAWTVDGMDALAVAEAAQRAATFTRAGGGPCFLELRTYRFRAHSMYDPELYRDKAEVEAWKQRDPLPALAARLRAAGALDEAALARTEHEIVDELADALAFADAAPLEPVEDLHRFVLASEAQPSEDQRASEARSEAESSEPSEVIAAASEARSEAEPSEAQCGSEARSEAKPSEARSGSAVKLTYREALRLALRDALVGDERVFLMGEDVGAYGGCFAVSKGLLAELGPERVRDTPLSEAAFVGAGIGAAVNGMRPIVEIMTVNFSLLALDQIVNTAATLLHMSGGQFAVPLVIRMATGGGRQLAAQHSHSLEGWYAHIPGLKVLAPGTHEDARGMLLGALRDPNPVLIFEATALLNSEGELADDAGAVSIHDARVRRDGDDVALISYGSSLPKTLDAAAALAREGISALVLDLRSLRPLDERAILAAVARTHRAVIVDEGWRSGSLSAEISARIMERAFFELDAPVARVCSEEVPVPYAKHLEEAALPSVEKIVAAAREVLGRHG